MGSKCFCQILLSGLIRGMRLWVEMFLFIKLVKK